MPVGRNISDGSAHFYTENSGNGRSQGIEACSRLLPSIIGGRDAQRLSAITFESARLFGLG
jgi:hypothetical protein